MRTLTQAIQSDQAEIILASCGLDASHLKDAKDPMDGFMKALIAKHSTEKKEDKKDDEKKDDDKKEGDGDAKMD